MNMLFFRFFSASIISLSLMSLFGCPNKPLQQPNLQVSQNPSDPSANTSSVSFGDVNVTQTKKLELVIRNSGNGAAILTSVGISGEYALLDSNGAQLTYQPCVFGMEIPGKENCSIEVEFIPRAVSSREGQLTIQYTKKENNDPRKELVVLTGKGNLDCTIQPDMLSKYNEGVSVATDRNTTEFTDGENSGLSLSEDQGYADGYAATYQTNYNASYKKAYDAAYDIAYIRGLAEGRSDTASCSQGSSAGQTDGFNKGKSVGYSDGYKDGYADGKSTALKVGYNNGYNAGLPVGRSNGLADGRADGEDYAYDRGYNNGYYDGDDEGYDDGYYTGYDYGYDSGYYDGSYSCKKSDGRITLKDIENITAKNKNNKLPGAESTLFLTACYNSGYNITYKPESFNNGYVQGAANNPDYQAGLSSGRTAGTNEGNADGNRAGQQAGDKDGQSDGVIAGKQAIYEECYANAYKPAWTNGYYVGYDLGDDKGYKDGYNDHYNGAYNNGYNVGFNVGYDDGYDDGFYTGNNSTSYYNSGYNAGYTVGYNGGYDEGYDYGYDSGYTTGYYDGQDDYCDKSLIGDRSKVQVPFIAKLHTQVFTEESLKEKIETARNALPKEANGMPTLNPEREKTIDVNSKILPENAPLNASGGEITLEDNSVEEVQVFKQIEIKGSELLRVIELPVSPLPAAIGKHTDGSDRVQLEEMRSLEVEGSLRSFLRAKILEQRLFAPLRLQVSEVPNKTEAQRRAAAKAKIGNEKK